MAEIIELSDDEDVIAITYKKSHKDKKFKCLNPDCRSEENLSHASLFIRKFYCVNAFKKKNKICFSCYTKVIEQKANLADSVRQGKLVLTNPLADRKSNVILSESDSDRTDSDSDSEESQFEFDPSELFGDEDNNGDMDIKSRMTSLINDICIDLNLKSQIEDGMKNVSGRLAAAEDGFKQLDSEFREIENNIDRLRANFYGAFAPRVRMLPPLDIDPYGGTQIPTGDVTEIIGEVKEKNTYVPPKGPLVRRLIRANDKVYCMKTMLFSRWIRGIVIKVERWDSGNIVYRINMIGPKETIAGVKSVSGRYLAYCTQCPTCIPIGTRVIARYRDENRRENSLGEFYVGVVAEIPTCANKYRYLIFFDDGYAQYVCHQDLRVVVESSANVWEDVSPDSREFIKDYLQTYPERPMVRLQRHNFIKTECNGRWWKAQVLHVDASLVKMFFPMNSRTEWIYRGSTRLNPLFNRKMSIQSQADQSGGTSVVRRRTMPYKAGPIVEYVNVDERKTTQAPTTEKRAVARKSTSGRAGTPPLEVQQRIQQESKGKSNQISLVPTYGKFVPHQCSVSCLGNEGILLSKKVIALYKPLIMSWRRVLAKEKKRYIERVVIVYIAPCGRRLRNIEEVFRFLRLTSSILEIDFFTFEIGVDPTTGWVPLKQIYHQDDITDGVEELPISCVNSLNGELPRDLIYCNVREPIENVTINTEKEFLVCCDCDDDCQDKTRCECWQLTFDNMILTGEQRTEIGYDFRRLHDQVASGIFECNNSCKCKRTCINRVVQNPIRHSLQLFKTARRGWGVRTLSDIPRGAFITVYVGRVLSENVANAEGKMITGGDDYYAELDLIESVETMKEGYESDVDDEFTVDKDNPLSSSASNTDDSDSVAVVPVRVDSYDIDREFAARDSMKPSKQRERSARIKSKKTSAVVKDKEMDEDQEGDDSVRQPQNFEPRDIKKLSPKKPEMGLRSFFGDDETVYIMDAKTTGNIGRYFNHSCQPNIYVQNVFVDTHDVRFPWIAFFSATNIRAGTELTWDYNYEVGSVHGKIKYCYCMSRKCRGRLL